MNHADRNLYTFSTFTGQLASSVPFYMVGGLGGGGRKVLPVPKYSLSVMYWFTYEQFIANINSSLMVVLDCHSVSVASWNPVGHLPMPGQCCFLESCRAFALGCQCCLLESWRAFALGCQCCLLESCRAFALGCQCCLLESCWAFALDCQCCLLESWRSFAHARSVTPWNLA